MKWTPILILFILALNGIYSCKKEDGQRVTTNGDSTKLKSIVALDTTQASGSDTGNVFYFNYDLQERLVKVTQITFLGGPSEKYEFHYIYPGADTLPSVFVRKFWPNNVPHTQPPVKSDTSYFFYTGEKIVRDSMVPQYSSFASVAHYRQLIPGQCQLVVRAVSRTTTSSYVTDSMNITSSYIGGNVVERKDTSNIFGVMTPRKFTFGYDNRINPLFRLAVKYPVYFPNDLNTVRSIVPMFLREVNKNGMLTKSLMYPNIAPYNSYWNLTYHPNGLLNSQTLVATGHNYVDRYFYGY